MLDETEVKLLADLAAIRATQDTHTKSLDSLLETINGNGRPGLKTVVDRHSATLGTIKRVFWIVATPILTSLAGGAVWATVWLVRNAVTK